MSNEDTIPQLPKLRITITAVIEYEANPAHYEGCSTPDQMLAVDLRSADEDPFLYLGSNVAEWKTSGEVVGAVPAASTADPVAYWLRCSTTGQCLNMVWGRPVDVGHDSRWQPLHGAAPTASTAQAEVFARLCEAEHVGTSVDDECDNDSDAAYNRALRDGAAAIRGYAADPAPGTPQMAPPDLLQRAEIALTTAATWMPADHRASIAEPVLSEIPAALAAASTTLAQQCVTGNLPTSTEDLTCKASLQLPSGR
jgi:hypothetical protein